MVTASGVAYSFDFVTVMFNESAGSNYLLRFITSAGAKLKKDLAIAATAGLLFVTGLNV